MIFGRFRPSRLSGVDVPDNATFEALARRALRDLPALFRRHLDGVVFKVEEFPDRETLDEMGIASRYDLLGLYTGVPIGEKSVGDVVPSADLIFLYRQPILRFARQTGESVEHVVRHVVVHEVGHHFGLSDEDMDRIEDDA